MTFIQAFDHGEAEVCAEEGGVSIDEVVMHLQTVMGTLKEMAKWFKAAEQVMDRAERFLEQFLTWRQEREQSMETRHSLDEEGRNIGDFDMGELARLDACNGEYDYDFEGIEIGRGGQPPAARQQHRQQQTTRPELPRQQSNVASLLGKKSAGDSDKHDIDQSGGQDWHTSVETDLVGYQGGSGGILGEQGFGTLWAGLLSFDNYSH